ncbi:MAG: glycosyl hydrolase 115 family protein [Saprospiraceae bacterium]
MLRQLVLLFLISPLFLSSQVTILTQNSDKKLFFTLVDGSDVATILYDAKDDILVEKSANFLASDIEKVTNKKPAIMLSAKNVKGPVIILGTIGKSALINQMIKSKKLKADVIQNGWERFIIETIKNPLPGIKEALVVVGSDKRGLAYGTLSISEKIGVSPWYYWADAPLKRSDNLYIKKERYVSNAPSVKYRGIFLNDEAPALRNWAKEQFGDFNHEFYEKVFELLLRNKANYLWPAMWQPSVFATDDPENARIADEYGIVISTTHHEPMMRYHEEWGRSKSGAWNYVTNKEKLQQFWKEGIERMGDKESVVALGMRGDGDEAMTKETAVDLMKEIMADQRKIISEVTGKPAKETPQVWALYKEVQDYYDKGMRVDDDIMVLFCDDNWGNVRILPKKEDLKHPGGYGMYYHFDFVGGPVSYRWINVSQIERVWEQMNLSYQWGVKDLWIVNVGDLKPMELPISLFLDFAYDTKAIRANDLPNYYVNWATQQFGDQHAKEIADILALTTKYSARRTPEMLKPNTYSLTNYREADRILEEYKELLERSTKVYKVLPKSHQSAYYQLVHFPIEIAYNLNEMYIAAGKNEAFGLQSRASTNHYAEVVKDNFFKDAALTKYYHDTLADGKWNHMMSQTHIGYTSWSNPPVNKMPAVTYIQPEAGASLGYLLESSPISRFRRDGAMGRSFTSFDPPNDQEYYLEIFNRGSEKLTYNLKTEDDWVKLSSKSGQIEFEEKVFVSIDWNKAPKGIDTSAIILTSGGQDFTIAVPIRNDLPAAAGFIENSGVVSIEAAHFTNKKDAADITWTVIPNLGRTADAVMVEPANAAQQTVGPNTPRLEYTFTIFDGSDLKIETYLSPTLNYKKNEGLKYAIAIDDETPQIININEGEEKPDWEYPEWWNNAVTDHIRKKLSTHKAVKAGVHTLKIWMIDPGLVFQKFVIDKGGLKPSYLGPPESRFIK